MTPPRTPNMTANLSDMDSTNGDTDFKLQITDEDGNPESEIGEDGEEGPISEEEKPPQSFKDNLAIHLTDSRRMEISTYIDEQIEEDEKSREDWINEFKKSLQYLGLKEETKSIPWANACGVVHPMLLEGVVRFQSRALAKLFPTAGPASVILDKNKVQTNPQIQAEIKKSEDSFNAHVTRKMPEVFTEMDRLLFSVADIGFAATKTTYHPKLKRVFLQYIKPEDFIMPYGCDNLEAACRYTEKTRRQSGEVDRLMESGYFLKEVLPNVNEPMDLVEEGKSKITGQSPVMVGADGFKIYECYVDTKIEEDTFGEGKVAPYIITIHEGTNFMLRIQRNWNQEDPDKKKIVKHVPYFYVPGDGSYGYGLVQLVGQIASSATKILRQLIDSGTLANVPGGWKSRDARVKNDGAICPGEWKDVDIDAEALSKAFLPFPFKEPSATLLQLLQLLIEEGKSFSSTADLDISASSQNAPVGTTLALLEKQGEVTNAVQLRLYTSFGKTLDCILSCIKEEEPEVYNECFLKLETLVGPGNFWLSPSGDPTAATLSQNVIKLQALVQMAQQSPQAFDIPLLMRMVVSALGVADANLIVPDKQIAEPMGIVEEHMAFLTNKPVQAFPTQDQDAHLTAHQALAGDPLYAQMLAKSPSAPIILAAIEAHIMEHLAFQYRNQIEKQLGTKLPPIGQPQPPQVDAALSQLVAQAAQQVAQQHAAQAQQMAQQQQQADPAYQLEKEELEIKKQDMLNKHSSKQAEIQQKSKTDEQNLQLEVMKVFAEYTKSQQANQLQSENADKQAEAHHFDLVHKIGESLLKHKQHGEQLVAQQDQQRNQLDSQEGQQDAQLQSQEKIAQMQAEAQKQAAKNKPKAQP